MSRTPKKPPTPWATVASAVRRELKAQRDKLGIPAEASIKVTSESFAGGASVDVDIDGADTWAWERAPADHVNVISGHVSVGDNVLTADVRKVGAAIEQIILTARTAEDAGYIWGPVTYHGTTIGHLARHGFTPGQD